ncbi:hypothetical protein Plhal304r1_c022g0077981 [Plasmopara halstedii]
MVSVWHMVMQSESTFFAKVKPATLMRKVRWIASIINGILTTFFEKRQLLIHERVLVTRPRDRLRTHLLCIFLRKI